MTYIQALRLKNGDKVKQKTHGYIMTVERIEECFLASKGNYVNVYCKTDHGDIMKHTHKEIMLA